MAKAKRHIHKYQRMNFKYSGKIWACRKPDCNHFIPRDMEETIEGKMSVCWDCGKDFILDPDALEMERPVCLTCRGVIPPNVDDSPLTPEAMKKYERFLKGADK